MQGFDGAQRISVGKWKYEWIIKGTTQLDAYGNRLDGLFPDPYFLELDLKDFKQLKSFTEYPS